MEDQETRVTISVRLEYAPRGSTKGFTKVDLTLDLSSGGIFVKTTRPYIVGTHLDLFFSSMDKALKDRFHATAMVKWIRLSAASEDLPAGMGLEIIDPNTSRAFLSNILRDNQDKTKCRVPPEK